MIAKTIPTLDIWKNVRTIADIGGGNGKVSKFIYDENKHIESIIVADLPPVRK